jgi:hypothetical protein
MQAGKKLSVRVRAARMNGSSHSAGAVALFFAPGKDPERVPADRTPDRQVILAFDAASRTYGAEVPTAGWAPGTWTVQGMVLGADGAPEGWDWHRFPVEP